jgi:hypothetical protein
MEPCPEFCHLVRSLSRSVGACLVALTPLTALVESAVREILAEHALWLGEAWEMDVWPECRQLVLTSPALTKLALCGRDGELTQQDLDF